MIGAGWARAGRTAALVLVAGASLAACATAGGPTRVTTVSPPPQPRHSSRPSHHRNTPPPMARQDGTPLRGTMKPYQVNGIWYEPREQPGYDETGLASWYGEPFHNRRTADGELFDMDLPSAAHKTLPLPSLVDVTNLETGRTVRLRVNDRGPFVEGRILDLSRQAARDLGVYQKGLVRVRVRYVGAAEPLARPEDGLRYAETRPTAAPEVSYLAARPTAAIEMRPIASELPPARTPFEPPERAALRIQAGAYANRGNAERAQARLAREGRVSIEPLQHGETTLWRVVVACEGDDALSRVAAAGFPDAKVLR